MENQAVVISILKPLETPREAWNSIVVVDATNHLAEACSVVGGYWIPREDIVFAHWRSRRFPLNSTTHLLQMRHNGSGHLLGWYLKKYRFLMQMPKI